ncbi:hypothetical protein MCOR17_006947 [Pyricularia oryzae]|nr:hypothetical protein MCOR17_006947 [Pyricularia oryzae]
MRIFRLITAVTRGSVFRRCVFLRRSSATAAVVGCFETNRLLNTVLLSLGLNVILAEPVRELGSISAKSYRFKVMPLDKYVARRLDNGFTATAEKQAFAESNEEKDRHIFLDALAENFPDTVELRYQILGVLFAGRDTTASLISWVFYNLARDPARYLKLRAKGMESWDSEQNAKHNATATMCSGTGVKAKLHTGGAWE